MTRLMYGQPYVRSAIRLLLLGKVTNHYFLFCQYSHSEKKTLVSIASVQSKIRLHSCTRFKKSFEIRSYTTMFQMYIFPCKKCLLVYSNFLVNFAKVTRRFTKYCLARLQLVKWILMLIFKR